MQFPGARGTFGGGNPEAPKVSPRKSATILPFMFWPTGPPRAENREMRGGWGHFGLGQPLALEEIRGGKQKTTTSHIEPEKRETKPLQLGPNTRS